jgi:hypothetical protein
VAPPSSCGRTGKCDGRGECQLHPAGTECAPASCRRAREYEASTCNGQGRCVPGASRECNGGFGCRGDTCAASCAAVGECNESSYCVQGDCHARLPAGTACGGDTDCATGFCADGHCCLSPECAPGAFCGGAGGICVNKIFTGSPQRCAASYECQSGFCVDGVCCAIACAPGRCQGGTCKP